MTKYKSKYRIESNRWQYWDYSAPGHYFLTICIANRQCILGNIQNGNLQLSVYGNMVAAEIQKLPTYHQRCLLDEWIVMPNHIHLLITLDDIADRMDENSSKNRNGNVEKIHEFFLPRPSNLSSQSQSKPSFQFSPSTSIYFKQSNWWYQPNQQPTTNEIKQYRKQRRNMLIPKILGKMNNANI